MADVRDSRSESANATPDMAVSRSSTGQAGQGESTVSHEQWRAMQTVLNNIYAYRAADGHDPSKVFHRKVNRRALPEYYEVIKEPMAMSTVKANINHRVYKNFSEFVRDFALILHNAQLYNRPEAGAYQDALVIKSVLEMELQQIIDQNIIPPEVAVLPDMGEIPPPSPRPGEEDGEEEDDDDEDDEDDEIDESEDEGGRRKRRGPRSTAAITKREAGGQVNAQTKGRELESRKKRGRPPKVDTPMEARIKAVLKGLRKLKDPTGELKINHFEKLPDKSVYPGYFTEITNPMALDMIKRKSKRKKYQSVEQLMVDVELMFENAKTYNRDDSQIYKDAVDLQREARILAEQEKKKPDSDYVMEDGRLPLPGGIMHNNEVWRVGDWVHIQNPNDAKKPIVAQLYRTWRDGDGREWINACWYYRPEQTVHRFERHFYENEVVKTGQYRDHRIDEVVDRCFVMFFTRYNKGRPRGFPPDKTVYVCESRYNEDKFKLNKIKTWASCLPDEVRDQDYEMDLFESPRRMKKMPSPLRHLLPAEAKETDALPKPTWGAPNAPPVVGAVHRRPREPNESPPPVPTPPPTLPPPAGQFPRGPPSRRGSYVGDPAAMGQAMPAGDPHLHHRNSFSRSGMVAGQQHQLSSLSARSPSLPHHPMHDPSGYAFPHRYSQELQAPAAASFPRSAPSPAAASPGLPLAGAGPAYRPPPLPQTPLAPTRAQAFVARNAAPLNSYHAQQYHPPQYGAASAAAPYGYGPGGQPRLPVEPVNNPSQYGSNGSAGTRTSTSQSTGKEEVYVLEKEYDDAIPQEIKDLFPCSEDGRVLFWTTPPLDVLPPVGNYGGGWNDAQGDPLLGHSVKYLAFKERQREELERKRRADAMASEAATIEEVGVAGVDDDRVEEANEPKKRRVDVAGVAGSEMEPSRASTSDGTASASGNTTTVIPNNNHMIAKNNTRNANNNIRRANGGANNNRTTNTAVDEEGLVLYEELQRFRERAFNLWLRQLAGEIPHRPGAGNNNNSNHGPKDGVNNISGFDLLTDAQRNIARAKAEIREDQQRRQAGGPAGGQSGSPSGSQAGN